MKKADVLKVIDEVMNNREIDSIRNAILAIRDKVVEMEDDDLGYVKLRMRDDHHPLSEVGSYFEGAKYVCVDPDAKVDTGWYGEIWYEAED